MAFQLSHPQGKMYKAARRRYLFLFLETANPLKGCWCLERECLWAEMEKKEGGLGWGRGKMGEMVGGGGHWVEGREEEGNVCLIQRKKRQFSPPVLCRTFSFDPPLLFLLPPTTPPTHTHRDTQGPADLQDITPASHFYLLHRDTCFLIYIFTLPCVYVHVVATGRHWGRREGNKEREWQKGSEGGREKGRVRIRLK